MSKLPRRFYETVRVVTRSVLAGEKSPCSSAFDVYKEKSTIPFKFYQIQLNGRSLRTQADREFAVHSLPLALAIAQEWRAQKKVVDWARMRLTGLAFTAVDNPLAETKTSLVSKILEFLDSDTLLYFANKDETGGARLLDLQQQRWAPIIRWVNNKHCVDLLATQRITDAPSVPEESRAKIERHLLAHNFAALIGLMYGVESVKSLLIVLATTGYHITVDEAVTLARLEQTFQTDTWGSVEWCHSIEQLDLTSRLAAATLFANFCSNVHEFSLPTESNAKIATSL